MSLQWRNNIRQCKIIGTAKGKPGMLDRKARNCWVKKKLIPLLKHTKNFCAFYLHETEKECGLPCFTTRSNSLNSLVFFLCQSQSILSP